MQHTQFLSILDSKNSAAAHCLFAFQIVDALTFLHVSCRYIHRNVCPNSVYVTKPGTWKLAGLEFLGKLSEALMLAYMDIYSRYENNGSPTSQQ